MVDKLGTNGNRVEDVRTADDDDDDDGGDTTKSHRSLGSMESIKVSIFSSSTCENRGFDVLTLRLSIFMLHPSCREKAFEAEYATVESTLSR